MRTATAARVVQPSSFGSRQSPSSESRWSSSQTSSNPAASAWRTASRSSGQPVRWIQNAAPNRIAIDEPPRPYRRGVATPPDPDALVPPALRDAVLAWYTPGRDLAFRATRDPYAVLVSELMAQQTQAERAAEAWTRWMARFPTVGSLAEAPVADVVRAWAGLGYNRRAVNLHRAAKAVMADHGGRVPDTVEGLMTLPGVGPYTARAVAAIAFGRRSGRSTRTCAGSSGGWRRAGPRRSRRRAAGHRRCGRPGGSGGGLDPCADGRRGGAVPRADASVRGLPRGRLVPVRGG